MSANVNLAVTSAPVCSVTDAASHWVGVKLSEFVECKQG